MDFTAHIRESDGMEQSVTEHCRNVAALAESYGESVGLGKRGKTYRESFTMPES